MNNKYLYISMIIASLGGGCAYFKPVENNAQKMYQCSDCEKDMKELQEKNDVLSSENNALKAKMNEPSPMPEPVAEKAGFWDWMFLANSIVSFAVGVFLMIWIRPAKKV
jgi:hypothetical protein